MSEPDDYGKLDRPHISIDAFKESTRYSVPLRPQRRRPLRENYAAHASSLGGQLTGALGRVPEANRDSRLAVIDLKPGVLIQVTTRPPEERSRTNAVKLPAKLEFPAQDIMVLRTERHEDRTESAVIAVPDEAREFLKNRILEYGSHQGNDRRPNIDRFEVIETIAPAPIELLFVGEVDFESTEVMWWELWVQGSPRRAEDVARLAGVDNLDVHSDRLVFPDTTVVFVRAAASALASFVSRLPGAISEVRRSTGTTEPFLDRGTEGATPNDWVADLARRVLPAPDESSVVCLLDTGVAAAHPLLNPGLKGAWAYDAAWGTDDHHPFGGHGTAVAGLILYGELESHMGSTEPVALTHDVESMKLLPPTGFPATEPPSYGVVTQGAVALVEIARPSPKRAFCLASSTDDFPPSRPSSWSGALDQIASGAMPGDATENSLASDLPKRLILVATGNVIGGMVTDMLTAQPIEDPSQSWNALTIGGFTRKEHHPLPPSTLKSVAQANHRSPYSRGSHSLPNDLTPIKPEVLFEAGNMVSDGGGFCDWHEAVSLLAIGSDVATEPLVPFWATSASVGVAGNFIGRLQAALPDLWPETHRALTVDSAQWPQPMRRMLVGTGAHWKTSSKRIKQKLLREIGYGVPEIGRAILSARNDLTLIAQAVIQPFTLNADGRGVFNEMHFYDLPWPRAALEQLENEVVTMKVTLSYFVEPNLAGKAATRPETYRSFGLRFAMKKRNETEASFRARVNAAQDADASLVEAEADCWLLGPKAVQAGSLHCDLWRGYAVDLAGHDAIAVYPVGGWWKSHIGQRRASDKGRYALVISICASGCSVDLHAEVDTLISVAALDTVIG